MELKITAYSRFISSLWVPACRNDSFAQMGKRAHTLGLGGGRVRAPACLGGVATERQGRSRLGKLHGARCVEDDRRKQRWKEKDKGILVIYSFFQLYELFCQTD